MATKTIDEMHSDNNNTYVSMSESHRRRRRFVVYVHCTICMNNLLNVEFSIGEPLTRNENYRRIAVVL